MAMQANQPRSRQDSSRDRIVPRDHVDIPTEISRGRQIVIHGQIVDLSRYGCHIRSAELFEQGDRLRILLPLVGDIAAQVAWSLVGCCGCRFVEPISRNIYPQILATVKMAQAEARVVVPLMASPQTATSTHISSHNKRFIPRQV